MTGPNDKDDSDDAPADRAPAEVVPEPDWLEDLTESQRPERS